MTSAEYHLLLQANGVNLLFSDISIRAYDKYDGVVLSTDGTYLYFMQREWMTHTKELYERFFKDAETVERTLAEFDAADRELESMRERVAAGGDVGLAEFDTFMRYAFVACDTYSRFDHLYTDHLFEDSRPEAAQFADIVLAKKNALREAMNRIFFTEDCGLIQLIRRIAESTGADEAALLYSPIDAIRQLLSGEEFIPRGKDGDDYAIVRTAESFKYYLGQEAVEFIAAFLVSEEGKPVPTVLKGTSVSKKAIVTGAVRKISIDYRSFAADVEALKAIPGGGILVTETTVPEMLPVMSRSLAIVTDMGGMLSHAAITSRELGIPCIVGVADATRVLKDGDMVEVDANTGTVTILERA